MENLRGNTAGSLAEEASGEGRDYRLLTAGIAATARQILTMLREEVQPSFSHIQRS
jgi:hypothetical protein